MHTLIKQFVLTSEEYVCIIIFTHYIKKDRELVMYTQLEIIRR